MKLLTVLTLAVLAITGASGQTPQERESVSNRELINQYTRALMMQTVYEAPLCKSARLAVVYYRNKTYEYQDRRHGERATRTPIVRGKACHWARYAAGVWQGRARAARNSYKKWDKARTLIAHNTWREAVNEAQKPYPGTEAWLLSCSGTEGGHGAWVPNRDGAPPGGWMQMYHSTWYRMYVTGWYDSGRSYPGARTYLISQGYRVPNSATSWYSPLGQALASAHGYTFGRRGEWHSSGCYIN